MKNLYILVIFFVISFPVLAKSVGTSKGLPEASTISVLEGSLFKKELFDLKMLAHKSKKFTGREGVVAYPIDNDLCKGSRVRHVQQDVLYELASNQFRPLETANVSLHYHAGLKEIKDYIKTNLSSNMPIIYYIMGSFTSCDKVSKKELDEKFRLSFGGGSGFSLGGFYDQESSELNRYCISLRLNAELHPELLKKGVHSPTTRTELCVYSDEYREGESANLSALGLVYDNGNYFVRGSPENRVKELLIKSSMISLISNFIGVPDISLMPFMKNSYSEYDVDTFKRKFKEESEAFQWNFIQSTLIHKYNKKLSYRDYGKLSRSTTSHLEKIEKGLSKRNILDIYDKLMTPLFSPKSQASINSMAVSPQINTYNDIENIVVRSLDMDLKLGTWKVSLRNTRCRGLKCEVGYSGTIDEHFVYGVENALIDSLTKKDGYKNISCDLIDKYNFSCSISVPRGVRINERKFKKNLKRELNEIKRRSVT